MYVYLYVNIVIVININPTWIICVTHLFSNGINFITSQFNNVTFFEEG